MLCFFIHAKQRPSFVRAWLLYPIIWADADKIRLYLLNPLAKYDDNKLVTYISVKFNPEGAVLMFGNQLRFTGMISGMDTHTIVQQLMRAESMRMDRLTRRRQLATWRQEQFRDIARDLRHFRDVNLDVVSRTPNVMQSRTFAAWESTVTNSSTGLASSAISVTPGQNTIPGQFQVKVVQAGTTTRVHTGPELFGPLPLDDDVANTTSLGTLTTLTVHPSSRTQLLVTMPSTPPDVPPSGWTVTTNTEQVAARVIGIADNDNRFGPITAFTKTVGGSITDDGYVVRFQETGSNDFNYYRVVFNSSEGRFEFPDINVKDVVSHTADPGVTDFDFDIGPAIQENLHTHHYNSSITINGVNINISSTDTVQEFIDRVNAQQANTRVRVGFNTTQGLTFETTNRGANAEIVISSGLTFLTDELEKLVIDNPAVTSNTVTENGVTRTDFRIFEANPYRIEIRDANGILLSTETIEDGINGNTFVHNGHTITLNSVKINETFTIGTTRNIETAVKAVQDFVNQYNALVMLLQTAHSTARPRVAGGGERRNFFEPLTEAERREMSDREIDRWEEQAKLGLLHRNSDIRSIQAQMRRMVNDGVDMGNNSRMFLHQIGITADAVIPGDERSRNIGLLRIDEDKLRAAIQQDPERVGRMFNRLPDGPPDVLPPPNESASARAAREYSQSGIAVRLRDFIMNVTGSNGVLTRIAGNEIMPTNNRLSRQIADYDRRLDRMQDWLVRREAQLFRQFSLMEQAMARSHQQMDSLFMFGMN
jgi:flagellar hook-associated protein 2